MVGVKGKSGNPNVYKYGFGARPRAVDDEYRSRQKGVPHKMRWTKAKCCAELDDILDILKKILKDDAKLEIGDNKKLKNEHIRDMVTMMNKILDYMRYLFPPVQQNLNVNVDVTANAVIDRLKNWKSEQVIVEEIDDNEAELKKRFGEVQVVPEGEELVLTEEKK